MQLSETRLGLGDRSLGNGVSSPRSGTLAPRELTLRKSGLRSCRSFEFINAVTASETADDIGTQLVQLAVEYGFSSAFGGMVPRSSWISRAEVTPLVLVQQFPEGWAARYNDRGYLFRDPVFHRLQTDMQPFSWADSYASCPNLADLTLIGGEAAEFGLTDGYVVPVTTLDHRVAAVSFGGRREGLAPDAAAALNFAVSFAVGHFLQLRGAQKRVPDRITPREFDCLLWAGEGKTDWEISVILGISRSTVTKHIAAAREKLGATNKTHAVALAMRRKMLA